jgi:hypothetical protein
MCPDSVAGMSTQRKAVASIAVACVALVFGYCATSRAAEPKRPNIVFFLIDDLGWADVGCFGSKIYVAIPPKPARLGV